MLICICENGFYPIEDAPVGVSQEQWAADNGKINSHIIEIQNEDGETLWTRVQ